MGSAYVAGSIAALACSVVRFDANDRCERAASCVSCAIDGFLSTGIHRVGASQQLLGTATLGLGRGFVAS